MIRLRDPLVMTGLAIALLCFVLFAAVIVQRFTQGANSKVEARLNGNQVSAAQQSGRDAVNTIATLGASEAAIDRTTLENDHAIRSAPGADAPVDPRVSDAGLRSLCSRRAYSDDRICLQFAPAR